MTDCDYEAKNLSGLGQHMSHVHGTSLKNWRKESNISCPECGDWFETERGMKIHHNNQHGESLARESAICDSCRNPFEYYPCESTGKICSNCSPKTSVPMGSRKKSKRKILKIKVELSCERCGEEDARCLDFHHSRGEKKFNIGNALTEGYLWDEVSTELKKCDLLCSNCHRKIHRSPVV